MGALACFLPDRVLSQGRRVTIDAARCSLSKDYRAMIIPTRARTFASAIVLSLAIVACGPKDADIKTSVDAAIAGVQGVTVNVVNGVAIISGQHADTAAKVSTEAAVKGVKGVKSVLDSATIAPPPVVISPDEMLKNGVTAALTGFSTLSADVKDGVVTLTGEIKRADLPKVMQALSALQPKKIENKATVKK
jgi:osmotically-inducible protein OsmY